MKHVPGSFKIKFETNPRGGRPIARFQGIIVMPAEEWYNDVPIPIGAEVEVVTQGFPNGKSGVLYVLPVGFRTYGKQSQVT